MQWGYKLNIKTVYMTIVALSVLSTSALAAESSINHPGSNQNQQGAYGDGFDGRATGAVNQRNILLDTQHGGYGAPYGDPKKYGFRREIGEITQEARRLMRIAKNSKYVAPTEHELDQFRLLISVFDDGNIAQAIVIAQPLNYEIVLYVDKGSDEPFFLLREGSQKASLVKGWGSLFKRDSSGNLDVLVEAPHPAFDINTPVVAAMIFKESSARYLLIAGAHRRKIDAAHAEDSMFHEAHKILSGSSSGTMVCQVHGFSRKKHRGFPNNTEIVLANGRNTSVPMLRQMDYALEANDFRSYSIEDGEIFKRLGATKNKQGIYSRSMGDKFLHIELSRKLRDDSAKVSKAANVIASMINKTAPRSRDGSYTGQAKAIVY